MEILCSHMTSSCRLVNLRQRFPEQSFSSPASKLPSTRKHKLVYVLVKETGGSLFDFSFRPRSSRWSRNGRSLTVNGLKNAESSVTSEGYSGYVIDGEGSLRDVAKSGQSSVRKILIPGLPEQIDGDYAASVSSSFTEWKPKFNIHYEKSGSENVNSPQVLFLPGFGVGSFHYEKQLKDLGRDFRVWALDFLGQGLSLPSEDPTRAQYDHEEESTNNSAWGLGDETQPWAENLVYSIDLWEEQVRYFVEEVIQEPVYLVGNSLGGYVALYLAARNPQLVKGITLLNATPFWGFLPNPVRSPILSRMFPWAGTFPLPARVKKLIQIVWQKISDPTSIREILKQVYADHLTNVDKVFSRILEVTEHPAAAASLASIMFAPQGELSFGEALSKCQIHNVPICLMYGKEDPWVTPIWGLQVKRQLPGAPYYQISPAGHCPHDEVPEAINYLLRGWIKNLESHGSVALPLLNGEESIEYNVARDLEFVREGSKKSVTVWFYGSKFSLWGHISSFIHSQFEDLRIMFQ